MWRSLRLACLGLVVTSFLPAQESRLRATLEGHSGVVYSVAFSPDGRTLVSGGSEDGIKRWDLASGNAAATFRCRSSVTCVALTPDGKTVAGAGLSNESELCDVSGKTIAQLKHGATWALATGRDPRRFRAARAEEVFSLAV